MNHARRLFWAAFWLALTLVGVKAYFLGVPSPTLSAGRDYLRSLLAISRADVLFVAVLWAGGRAVLWLGRGRRVVALTVVACSALLCSYALANVVLFDVFGGFLTYSLVWLVADVRMLSASVAARFTGRVLFALAALPFIYAALVSLSLRLSSRGRRPVLAAATCASMVAWVILGQSIYAGSWATRQEHRIAESPHWVMLASSWRAVREGCVRLPRRFNAADLSDFDPIGARPTAPVTIPGRPPNVILLVLESVAARWTSVNGGLYETTPSLRAASTQAMAFDNAYAHVGRSSDSLPAMLLSRFPTLDFRDMTEHFPRLPGTSLATVFERAAYRTAFMTSTDLTWGGWRTFLERRGFKDIVDYRRLPCTAPLSEWGVEDRCLVDGMIAFINRDRGRPFFVMSWTQQTHYPYEPTPSVPLLTLTREPGPDDYELERYLNVLHETDRHLQRLLEAIGRAGLDQDTLVVVTGDHGQAFGSPHPSYAQGVTAYEEDVHVPLLFWFPRRYQSPVRSNQLASHVDLAPTIAEFAGLPPAPDWQGRSLLGAEHVPRAYFYVAEDRFTLGVRELNWKYLFDLRAGTDELFDLDRDPTEQHNLAREQPERCARFRERLAAWMEANGRQYSSEKVRK